MRAIGSSIVCQTCLLGERLAVGNAFVALDRARRARLVIALGLIKRNGRVKALRIPAFCRGFSHAADSGFHPRGAFSFHFYLAEICCRFNPSGSKLKPLRHAKADFFAPDLIASKPLKPCDGGIFRGLQFAPVFAAKRSGAARPAFQYPALPPGLRRANKPAVRAPWLAKRSRRARLGSTRKGRQISTRSPSCRGASGAQGRPQMP